MPSDVKISIYIVLCGNGCIVNSMRFYPSNLIMIISDIVPMLNMNHVEVH